MQRKAEAIVFLLGMELKGIAGDPYKLTWPEITAVHSGSKNYGLLKAKFIEDVR